MRLYFTEYCSDMARFVELRDMESRTAPQEAEFSTLLAELEANEASVGSAVDTLREISGATYVIVSDTAGAEAVKTMVDEGAIVEETTINNELNGVTLYNYYLSLF